MTEWHLGHVPGTVIVDEGELKALRARCASLEAVAEAGRDILAVLHWTPDIHPKIVAFGVALAALDQDAATTHVATVATRNRLGGCRDE